MMNKAEKCKRCEEAEQATHDESNWLKKRWAKKDKWADRSVSTTGKWEDGR
jgi:hypothetical protein